MIALEGEVACECPDKNPRPRIANVSGIGCILLPWRPIVGRCSFDIGRMKMILLGMLLLPLSVLASDGSVPGREVSLAGIVVGDSPGQVEKKLGKPSDVIGEPDFLGTHYRYSQVRVSFSEGVVAGIYSEDKRACTPRGLCVGDSVEKMRAVYGSPLIADRETGSYYEYYGRDLSCWLQIPANRDKIDSIRVACQP